MVYTVNVSLYSNTSIHKGHLTLAGGALQSVFLCVCVWSLALRKLYTVRNGDKHTENRF